MQAKVPNTTFLVWYEDPEFGVYNAKHVKGKWYYLSSDGLWKEFPKQDQVFPVTAGREDK